MIIHSNTSEKIVLIKRRKLRVIQNRSLFRRAIKNLTERNPSKIGRWPANHPYAKESKAYGKNHYEIVDDSIAENPTAEQEPYILTSQKDVQKYDSTVTEEVHQLSDKQAISGENKLQYGAGKDRSQKRTHEEYSHFQVERPTTPEEDAEFQKSRKKDPSAKIIYKRPPQNHE